MTIEEKNINQLYQQLLELTESLLLASTNNEWEKFSQLEEERTSLIHHIDHKNSHQISDPSIIEKIYIINKKVLEKANAHYALTKDELLKLNKSKKANNFYNL